MAVVPKFLLKTDVDLAEKLLHFRGLLEGYRVGIGFLEAWHANDLFEVVGAIGVLLGVQWASVVYLLNTLKFA